MSYECITRFAGKTQANPGTSPDVRQDEDGTLQYFQYVPSEVLREFQQTLYDSGLIDTNYIEHLNEAGLAHATAESLDVSAMDAPILLSILTKCVRAERFCEGALGAVAKSGLIDRCLARLKEIDCEG